MKRPTLLMAIVWLASGGADAQTPREVAASAAPIAPLMAPASASPSASSDRRGAWIVSETRSPIDYSPVAVATATSNGLQLAIQCRGGRTEVVLSSLSRSLSPRDHVAFYAVDSAPLAVAVGPTEANAGLAVKADMLRFLMALPEHGDLVLRITDQAGDVAEGRYGLADMKKLMSRLAGPCAWPTRGGR